MWKVRGGFKARVSGKCGKIANRLQWPPHNQLQAVIVRNGERSDALESEYARNKKLAGVGARCVNLPSLPGNQVKSENLLDLSVWGNSLRIS